MYWLQSGLQHGSVLFGRNLAGTRNHRRKPLTCWHTVPPTSTCNKRNDGATRCCMGSLGVERWRSYHLASVAPLPPLLCRCIYAPQLTKILFFSSRTSTTSLTACQPQRHQQRCASSWSMDFKALKADEAAAAVSGNAALFLPLSWKLYRAALRRFSI